MKRTFCSSRILPFSRFSDRHQSIVSDITDDANEVPTLHVLFSQPHTQPLFRYLQSASDGSVYDDLVDWIAEEGLAGDRDVAEWVLLACISRVYGADYISYSLLLNFDVDNRGNLLCCHLPLPSPDFHLQSLHP